MAQAAARADGAPAHAVAEGPTAKFARTREEAAAALTWGESVRRRSRPSGRSSRPGSWQESHAMNKAAGAALRTETEEQETTSG